MDPKALKLAKIGAITTLVVNVFVIFILYTINHHSYYEDNAFAQLQFIFISILDLIFLLPIFIFKSRRALIAATVFTVVKIVLTLGFGFVVWGISLILFIIALRQPKPIVANEIPLVSQPPTSM